MIFDDEEEEEEEEGGGESRRVPAARLIAIPRKRKKRKKDELANEVQKRRLPKVSKKNSPKGIVNTARNICAQYVCLLGCVAVIISPTKKATMDKKSVNCTEVWRSKKMVTPAASSPANMRGINCAVVPNALKCRMSSRNLNE